MFNAQDLISHLGIHAPTVDPNLAAAERLFKNATSLLLVPVMIAFPGSPKIDLLMMNRSALGSEQFYRVRLANMDAKYVRLTSTGETGLPHFCPRHANHAICTQYAVMLTLLGFDVHMFSVHTEQIFNEQIEAAHIPDLVPDIFSPQYRPEIFFVIKNEEFEKTFGFVAP